MLHFIKQIVKVNEDFSILCLFNNNELRLIDLSDWVEQFRIANDGWASRISDPAYFKTVVLDSYGTLKWDNELDFCTDVLYSISRSVAA